MILSTWFHRDNLDEYRRRLSNLSKSDLATMPSTARQGSKAWRSSFTRPHFPSVPRSIADPVETHNACVNGTFNLVLSRQAKPG